MRTASPSTCGRSTTAPTMEWLVDIGVDGVMTDRPTLLEQVLAERKVRYRAPRGSKR